MRSLAKAFTVLAIVAVLVLTCVAYSIGYPAGYYASSDVGFPTWNVTISSVVVKAFVNFYPGVYFNNSLLGAWELSSPYLPFSIVGVIFRNASIDYSHFETFAVSAIDCNVTMWKLTDSELVFTVGRDTARIHALMLNNTVTQPWTRLVENDFCIVVFKFFNRSTDIDVVQFIVNGSDWTGRRVSDVAKLFDFSVMEPRWYYNREMRLLIIVTPLHSQLIMRVSFGIPSQTTVTVPITVKEVRLYMPTSVIAGSEVTAIVTIYLEQSPTGSTQISGVLRCSGPTTVEKTFSIGIPSRATRATTTVIVKFTHVGMYTCVSTVGNVTSPPVYVTVEPNKVIEITPIIIWAIMVIAIAITATVIAMVLYRNKKLREQVEEIIIMYRPCYIQPSLKG